MAQNFWIRDLQVCNNPIGAEVQFFLVFDFEPMPMVSEKLISFIRAHQSKRCLATVALLWFGKIPAATDLCHSSLALQRVFVVFLEWGVLGIESYAKV